ncbi:hypothetical protein EIP86_001796 [Pleurotus ostreatoroseus]|nr:hypothetical protein EIP86_001796 [Pleurotus ostreatoroseus]
MSYWPPSSPYNARPTLTNPRDNYYAMNYPGTPWRTPVFPRKKDILDNDDCNSDDSYHTDSSLESGDDDEACPCADCGKKKCRCRKLKSRTRRERSQSNTPHVPRVKLPRSSSRSRLPIHNPGVAVRPERAHKLTRNGHVRTPSWTPMNPFVGPSLIGSPGKKGEPQVATPFINPDGQLPEPARWYPSRPFPPAHTPRGSRYNTPVIPTPPVVPATPSYPAAPAAPSYQYPWNEHPWPAPNVPGPRFWPRHSLSYPRSRLDVDPYWVSGGNDMPGTRLDAVIDTPEWPPRSYRVPMHLHPYLAPNPYATTPHFDWDISLPPDTARRVTGRNCVVDISAGFDEVATWPPTNVVLIASDFILQESWGPIVVRNSKSVTFLDVLAAIYEYWQTPLTEKDVHNLQKSDPQNYRLMVDAYFQRCKRSPSIREWEMSQGLRRVDLFGDNRKWWGLWLSYGGNGTWYANLGTISVPYRWE